MQAILGYLVKLKVLAYLQAYRGELISSTTPYQVVNVIFKSNKHSILVKESQSVMFVSKEVSLRQQDIQIGVQELNKVFIPESESQLQVTVVKVTQKSLVIYQFTGIILTVNVRQQVFSPCDLFALIVRFNYLIDSNLIEKTGSPVTLFY
eukprot:403341663